MNKRLAALVIKRNHEKFIESIDDPKIKDLIAKNSIVSGGCITSLLLGEPVNDFDYYFTDMKTTELVAEYFIAKFKKQNSKPQSLCKVEVNEGRVSILIPSHGVARAHGTEDLSQAEEQGGLPPESSKPDAKQELFRPVYITSNAITLSDKIQLIVRFYGDVAEIHKNFDFVHCTNSWTSKDGVLALNQPALESILSKNLFYSGSLYPLSSIIRTRKFIKRGWHINAGQYLKMCFQLSELDLMDVEILKDQLVGVDSAYFHQVIVACKAKQQKDANFNVTVPYLTEIVDRIFS